MLLITGSNGQVGHALQILAQQAGLSHLAVDRVALDLTDAAAIKKIFAQHKFTHCINCAAYTAVDKAESEPEAAKTINATAAGNLAEICVQHGTRLLHLSTDYVYGGQQNEPILEDAPTLPQGVYAATKLAGEQLAQKAAPDTIIVRTSWVYHHQGHNFVKSMLRLAKDRDQLGIVFDQIGSPTYAMDLAAALLAATQKPEIPGGIYHFSNEGVCSWFDFALAIFELKGIDIRVKPIRSAAYPTPAKRPAFSLLDKSKIKSTLGLDIRHWREALVDCLGYL